MTVKRKVPTASGFSIVLGLSSLGQGWIVALKTWALPPIIGPGILTAAAAATGRFNTEHIPATASER
ncbi:MAG: hypothetical protein KGH75_02805 [Rhodospirillales bacterium]|nr:hypothetical protein [Rhodospirillales bacterium]